MAMEIEVPDTTVAVVLLSRTDDGSLLARYAEARGQVSATRSQTIDALLRLAVELDDQRAALTAAENGADR